MNQTASVSHQIDCQPAKDGKVSPCWALVVFPLTLCGASAPLSSQSGGGGSLQASETAQASLWKSGKKGMFLLKILV